MTINFEMNANSAGELLIKHGGKHYTYGANGLFESSAAGVATGSALKGLDAHGPLGQVLQDIKDSPKSITPQLKTALATHVPNFTGHIGDEVLHKEVASALKFSDDIKTKAASLVKGADGKATGSIKGIRTRLITSPLGESLLDDATRQNLISKGFDWAEFNKIKGLTKTLTDHVAAEAPDVNAIRKMLIDNLEHADELVGTIQRSGGTETLYKVAQQGANLTSMPTEIRAKIAEDILKAKTAAQEVVTLEGRIKSLKGIKSPTTANTEALKTAEEAFAKQTKEFGTLIEGDYGQRVAADLERNAKPLMDNARKASTEISSRLGSVLKAVEAGTPTADKGRGFFTKLFEFKRTDKFMEELAAKEKSTVGEMIKKHGPVGSTRWGKVIGAGAIVTAAVVGGMSYFGKEKEQPNKSFAEAEMQKRAAAGQAAGAGLSA